MQSKKRNRYSRSISRAFLALLATVALSSCERIFEDLAPCPHGVSLRFVYDYNMEYANAFPAQVDCLTLYIYDDEDNYVDTRIVTGTELQDENYRMTLDLEEGDYHSWLMEEWHANKVPSHCRKPRKREANVLASAPAWMPTASLRPNAADCTTCSGDNSHCGAPTSTAKAP